jgi:hypothetical protein
MDIYKIPDNLLSPYCRGKFDKSSGKFIDTTSLEVIKCCKELCNNWIQYCKNTCNDIKGGEKCFNTCNNLTNICEAGCLEINSPVLDIIKNCSIQNNCNLSIRKDCLKSKKDAILQCCKDKCKTDNSIDCTTEDICNEFINYLTDTQISTNISLTSKKDTSKNFFLFFLIIPFVLLVFYLLIKQIEKLIKNK